MKTLKNFITERKHSFKTIKDVESFLSKWKDNETSWAHATDEIRDIAKMTRQYLHEYDEVDVEAIDFKAIKNPAEWNSRGKEYILKNIKAMSNTASAAFMQELNTMFS